MIRRILLTSTALASMSGMALAADLTMRPAPAPFVPPAFTWTGFYVGINAGGSLGEFTTTDLIGEYSIGDEYKASSKGFSGGGQIGFNYEFPASNFVLGVEADFQGSTLRGSYDSFESSGGGWNDNSNVNWWGTARGRIGYAFGNFLPYATGGVAYGHVATSGSCSTGSVSSCDQAAGSVSGTHIGWTAGAGVEYAITNNLTFKVEYLYTDLGSLNVPNYYLAGLYGGPIYSSGDNMQTRTTFSTVRAGINYKF
jgi:outer membrane immunogenic protein